MRAMPVLLVLVSLSARAEGSWASKLPMPADEQWLCETLTDFRNQYQAAKAAHANQLKLSSIRTARADVLKKATGWPKTKTTVVKAWVGTLVDLRTTSSRRAVVSIRLPCEFHVGTWGGDSSDGRDRTLVEPRSQMYRALSEMQLPQLVSFDGDIPTDSEDGSKEKSLTEDGSMTDPDLLIRFSAIRLYPGPSKPVSNR